MSQTYAKTSARRRKQIEAALKPGDIIIIDKGAYRNQKATFIETRAFGNDWMPVFYVQGKRQHFGPTTVLRILGIPDED
jgi:hypothetical protein